MSSQDTNSKRDYVKEMRAIANEGTAMRKRHLREQAVDDTVMKVLFVVMCPLLFPILFMRD